MKIKFNLEAIFGGLFIAICCTFLYYAFAQVKGGVGENNRNMILFAKFNSIEGISTDSPVKIGGVNVGKVMDVILDKQSFAITVKIVVDDDLKLATDAVISVSTSGLIGQKFLQIKQGIDDVYMKNGDYFSITESARNIEDLISKFVAK